MPDRCFCMSEESDLEVCVAAFDDRRLPTPLLADGRCGGPPGTSMEDRIEEDFDFLGLLAGPPASCGTAEEFAFGNFFPCPIILRALSTLVLSAAVMPSTPSYFLGFALLLSARGGCFVVAADAPLPAVISRVILARLDAFDRV